MPHCREIAIVAHRSPRGVPIFGPDAAEYV
jgi:hypothetical protein